MSNKPIVSIVCVAYNHEKFIQQTLESFIMQKANFDFEIIIGEDCSTDKTREIIKEFEKKYPNVIKPIFREKNIGTTENFFDTLRCANGKYIVICDGDDFFIDENKLQLQVDFLDKNLDYAVCFHSVKIFFENKEGAKSIYPRAVDLPELTTLSLLKNNFIPTMSVMYRRQNYKDLPKINIVPGDWYLHLYHAKFGKIGFIDKTMSAYRRHSGGIWWDSHGNKEGLFKKHGVSFIAMYFELLKLFGKNLEYRQIISYHVNYLLNVIIEIDKKEKSGMINEILLKFPNNMSEILSECLIDNNEFKKDIVKKDIVIQKNELIIQKQSDELHDLYHSRVVTPAIKLRYILRNVVYSFRSLRNKIEGRIVCLAKKYLSEEIRSVIRPYLPRRYRVLAKKVKNEKWEGILISVVTPFFNHGKTLGETVESVLGQTFQNFEYIIVNDGSTDAESNIVFEKINHPKIIKITQENQGVAAGRNNGIIKAKGKYILCLDSDDIIAPTYLEKMLVVLESNPDIDIVYSHMNFFGIEERIFEEPEFDPQLLYSSNIITTASVFRKSVWEKSGGYKRGIGFEDWEFWINLVENGSKARLFPEPVFNYRRAVESRYIDDKKKRDENIEKIKKLHPRYLKRIKELKENWIMQRNIFEDNSQFVNLKNSKEYLQGKKEKKNVLILMPWLTFGGAETLVYNYCSKIKNDFNISIITGLKSENEWEYKFKEVTNNIYHLPNLFLREEEYFNFVANYIESRKIDVLHIVHNSSFYEMLPDLRKRFPRLKVISTVFNVVADHFNNSIKYADFIDIYTTDNTKVLKAYDEQSAISSKEKIVIYNGIDCNGKFNPVLYDRLAEREKLNINKDDIAVYFMGRLSPEKNPDIFVEAAKKVLDNGVNIKFFVIGDGPMRMEIEKTINEFGDKNLSYLGYQADIPCYLSTADIFVLPSKAEGFPLSNVEAMAMGVCVIASDVGGVSDAIKDAETGFLMQPNSPSELVEKIEYVLSQKEILEKISKNARKSVEENFSIEILADKYKNLYENINE
ncbi:MAG TPA: hypothetical protein DEA43_00250 [Candidatus Moranbacteria bacterium]|nr:hypothetical protein [Candidatus Moranbacteria bacterium]HBT45302.1 hypothetical protein [Candidatus Moranbacteria bacterium]